MLPCSLCRLLGAATTCGEQARTGFRSTPSGKNKVAMPVTRTHKAAAKAGWRAAAPAATASTTQSGDLPDDVLGIIFGLAGEASGCAAGSPPGYNCTPFLG